MPWPVMPENCTSTYLGMSSATMPPPKPPPKTSWLPTLETVGTAGSVRS
jgi:hypothetical protein